jgi:hypothetical protein
LRRRLREFELGPERSFVLGLEFRDALADPSSILRNHALHLCESDRRKAATFSTKHAPCIKQPANGREEHAHLAAAAVPLPP